MQNRVMKYMTRIGQNTGMLKKSKNVHTNAITVAFVAEYQNLNSGNLNNESICFSKVNLYTIVVVKGNIM